MGLPRVRRYKLPQQADPTQPQEVATKAYVDSGGGGGLWAELGTPSIQTVAALEFQHLFSSVGQDLILVLISDLTNVRGSVQEMQFSLNDLRTAIYDNGASFNNTYVNGSNQNESRFGNFEDNDVFGCFLYLQRQLTKGLWKYWGLGNYVGLTGPTNYVCSLAGEIDIPGELTSIELLGIGNINNSEVRTWGLLSQ